jgi:hypothetical protein
VVRVSDPVDFFLGNQRSPPVQFDLIPNTCMATERGSDRVIVLTTSYFPSTTNSVAPEILILFR